MMRVVRHLQWDVIGVVDGKEICLVTTLYVYHLERQDRASLPRQTLRQGPTAFSTVLHPGSSLLL